LVDGLKIKLKSFQVQYPAKICEIMLSRHKLGSQYPNAIVEIGFLHSIVF